MLHRGERVGRVNTRNEWERRQRSVELSERVRGAGARARGDEGQRGNRWCVMRMGADAGGDQHRSIEERLGR